MKIEFCIHEIDSFLLEIAGQLGLEIENNGFTIPPEQGKGYFKQIELSKNITISYYELLLHETCTIIRKKSDNDSIVPIVFWMSDKGIRQELNSENKEIGKDTPHGIFLPANSIETTYTFPKNVPVKSFTILINKEWLRENTKNQNNYLSNVILSSKSYFLFEEISYEMSELLTLTENCLIDESKDAIARIKLYANTLQLIGMCFEKILQRPLSKQLINMSQHDVQALFKLKAILLKNYINIPSTDELAKECGINKRKLQRLFKQVFGKSIYQFAIEVKMIEAKKMLSTKKYSVSEVGYTVGYSNLSHFTEKFKAHFGISPRSFVLSS